MVITYIDASVALRTLLDVPERGRLQAWMQTPDTTYVSSRLLRTEIVRVLRRDDRPPSDAAPLLERVGLVDITRETHAVAESLERHINTLDALHLATAVLIGEPVVVASHDRVMKEVATHLGLGVTDPVDQTSDTRPIGASDPGARRDARGRDRPPLSSRS